MTRKNVKPVKTTIRCEIYTRKSSEEGLDQEFNSLDAQREAAEAFILSQKAEGWKAAGMKQSTRYDVLGKLQDQGAILIGDDYIEATLNSDSNSNPTP